jgi:hypothetical protein
VTPGKKIYYQGRIHDFDTIQLPGNPDCLAHVSYPQIMELPIGTDLRLGDFLELVCRPEYSGKAAVLDFRGYRNFVTTTACRLCGREIEFYRPAFRILDTELVCESCRKSTDPHDLLRIEGMVQRKVLPDFSLENTPGRVLQMSLRELGVPYWPVLAVQDRNGAYQYYECTQDREKLIPRMLGIE